MVVLDHQLQEAVMVQNMALVVEVVLVVQEQMVVLIVVALVEQEQQTVLMVLQQHFQVVAEEVIMV